jgi:hypothetical protein
LPEALLPIQCIADFGRPAQLHCLNLDSSDEGIFGLIPKKMNEKIAANQLITKITFQTIAQGLLKTQRKVAAGNKR